MSINEKILFRNMPDLIDAEISVSQAKGVRTRMF